METVLPVILLILLIRLPKREEAAAMLPKF
jgi:hypothetical protein